MIHAGVDDAAYSVAVESQKDVMKNPLHDVFGDSGSVTMQRCDP